MVVSGTTVHILGLVNPAHICHRTLTDWQVLLCTELHPSPRHHRMWPYMEMTSLQMILVQMTSSWSKVDSSSNKNQSLKTRTLAHKLWEYRVKTGVLLLQANEHQRQQNMWNYRRDMKQRLCRGLRRNQLCRYSNPASQTVRQSVAMVQAT